MWMLQTDDAMSLTPEELAEAIKQIKRAIKPPRAKTSDTFIPSWIQAACAILGVVSIIFSVAWWCSSVNSDLKSLQGTVGEIKTSFNNLQGAVWSMRAAGHPREVLKGMAAADPSVLAKSLSVLEEIAQQPPSEFRADAKSLQEVAYRLDKAQEKGVEYWRTALRFSQFATAALYSDVPPAGPPWGLHYDHAKGLEYRNGSLEGVPVFFGDAEAKVTNATFVKCRIIFAANATVHFEKVTFINCVFEFPSGGDLLPPFREIAKTLLATGLKTAFIPSA